MDCEVLDSIMIFSVKFLMFRTVFEILIVEIIVETITVIIWNKDLLVKKFVCIQQCTAPLRFGWHTVLKKGSKNNHV